MATGKVVALTRRMDPETWAIFMGEKPAGWEVTLVNMDDGEQKVINELEDAQYVLSLGSGVISQKLLEVPKQLKLIQNGGQDMGHLPVPWALEKGIPICNAGGANAIAVSEYTVFLMLACLRRFRLFNQSIHEGKFRGAAAADRKSSHELYSSTVGIVGFGNIGRRVAKLCYGFGANIIYFERFFVPYALRADSKARPVSFDELISTSDIISLHVPSLQTNRGMMSTEQFNKMKPSACIINTSRGVMIDEAALVRALNEKQIAGAGLDVWEPEPPDPKNPLLQMPNVIASPHIAGSSWENAQPAYENIWRNVLLVSEGKEPLSRIREF